MTFGDGIELGCEPKSTLREDGPVSFSGPLSSIEPRHGRQQLMTIENKVKELIAVGASITANCCG